MTSMGMPRTLKRMVAAVAVTALPVAIPAAAHAASAPASKTVSYLGHEFTVPSSWPVVDLASAPNTCVRFDRHAVYLGVPGTDQQCPNHVAGRTDALLIQPTSSVTGAALAGGATENDATSHQLVSSGGGVTVTGTYSSSPQLDLDAISSAGLPVPSGSGGTTSMNTAMKTPASTLKAGAPSSTAGSQAAAATTTVASSAVNYTGEAFDECQDPSPSDLSSWSSSPFRAVGIYIGGANMACEQPSYTAADIASDVSEGWHFYTIYVGLQAPTNTCGCSTFTSPAQQGAAAAEDAVTQAQSAGFGAGTPIFFDLEAYTPSSSVTSQVLAFLNAWTQQLHAEGYASGVYGALGSAVSDLVTNYGSITPPDAIAFADWNNQASTAESAIPTDLWANHQRVHQYTGYTSGPGLTYGGLTLDVDQDYVDLQGFTSPVTTTAPTGTHESSQAVAQNSGTVDLMYQGTNNETGHLWFNPGSTWAGPQYFTGGDAPISQPTTVTTTATNVTTFWEGAGGTLWSDYYYSGHAWGTPYQVGGYTNVFSAPQAVAQANGEMEVFWVDQNGAVWVGQFNGTTWLPAVDLGGSVAAGTALAPAASAPGMVEVFFEGSGDETLWEAGTADYGSDWSTASDIGASWGQLNGSPGATGHSNGNFDVFWSCTTAANLCGAQSTMTTGWGSMQNLGGTIAAGTSPAPAVSADQTTDVFFEGPSGNLWHVYSNDYGQTWAAPADLGMGTITQPTVTAESNGAVIVLWKGSGTSSSLWEDSYAVGAGWQSSALDVGGSEV